MPRQGRRDLIANRWEPFVHTFDFEGFNLTGAAIIAQVRLTPDASGSALIDLTTVGSVGTQGITITGTSTVGSVTTTHLSMRINESTMEALPAPTEVGDDLTLYWDMQITPSGGVKYRALEGTFIVDSGVTH